VSGEALRCPECGADPRSGQSDFGDPDIHRLRVCQGVRLRAAALLIDATLLFAAFLAVAPLGFLLLIAFGLLDNGLHRPSSLPLWLAFATGSFLYLWLAEGIWGQTVGKRLLGLRVLTSDGSRPSLARCFLRNLLLPVEFLPALFLLGTAAIYLSPKRQRLGDLVAGTVVVRRQAVSRRQLAARSVPAVLWRSPAR